MKFFTNLRCKKLAKKTIKSYTEKWGDLAYIPPNELNDLVGSTSAEDSEKRHRAQDLLGDLMNLVEEPTKHLNPSEKFLYAKNLVKISYKKFGDYSTILNASKTLVSYETLKDKNVFYTSK